MKVIIGADIVPTISNQTVFEKAQMEQIVDKRLLDIMRSADYRIFNLEVPLADTETPIRKAGAHLIAPCNCVVGIKQLGIDFLTLANNHIFDHGEQGLWSTVKQLNEVNIAYAGIGRTVEEAAKPYIADLHGMKLGIYCCAEHEFSIASDKLAGANPFDSLESLDHIADLKGQCDYLICLYHGGKEHYRYPSPNLQKRCRKMVEKGADLVICQHTHCIGCEEKWKDGTIVYGQGNFLFDYSDIECWQTSVLVSVDLDDRSVTYIPIQKNGNGVKSAEKETGEKILSDMEQRTKQIQQNDFVEKQYTELAKSMINEYMSRDCAITKKLPFRVVNKLSGYRLGNKIIQNKIARYRYIYINQYDCEAHRELILKGLEVAKQ